MSIATWICTCDKQDVNLCTVQQLENKYKNINY